MIEIMTNDGNFICQWEPFERDNYLPEDMPSDGYLGTARTIGRPFNIGFHAWEQTDHEFVWYRLMSHPVKPTFTN